MLDAEERARFLDGAGRPRHPDELPWELLYRVEPELYDRLVAGERLHEGILGGCPAVSGGARGGRGHRPAHPGPVGAVRPAGGGRAGRRARDLLERRLDGAGAANVSVARGFFDALPEPAVVSTW